MACEYSCDIFDSADGEKIYSGSCVSCHGASGEKKALGESRINPRNG